MNKDDIFEIVVAKFTGKTGFSTDEFRDAVAERQSTRLTREEANALLRQHFTTPYTVDDSQSTHWRMCLMDIEQVVPRLKGGWELRKFGTGWHLSTPLKVKEPHESFLVHDDLMHRMKEGGQLEFLSDGKGAVATLVSKIGN